MDPEPEPAELKWSAQYTLSSRNTRLPGDKILLPPSALEQLLAAAPVVNIDSDRPHITAFDPFIPTRSTPSDRHARSCKIATSSCPTRSPSGW
jgi:hypothetical protein